jgi:hypothetical protein
MRNTVLIFCIVVFCSKLDGQAVPDNLQGEISFVSSQNIYVRFKSTAGISRGDTLFILSDGNLIPALKVNNLSSISCLCIAISDASLTTGKSIIAKPCISLVKPEVKVPENEVNKALLSKLPGNILVTPGKERVSSGTTKQKINGSISVNSYSDFSTNSATNSQRFSYIFSLDAKNISDSKLSVESYITFKHKIDEWGEVKSDLFNALKIYDIAVRYNPDRNTQISLGRKINQRISNIGAIDGLQVEKTINKFTIGAIVGLRPSYKDYGLDTKLFQYGAYVAFNTRTPGNYTESSLAIMQQTNNSKTDRRFLYFQHAGSLVKNLDLFSTFEVDLYKIKNNVSQSTFDLTGLYLSMRFRMTKDFTLSTSYDARKNVTYFETYKTFLDRILETGIRQSLRLQANYQISKDLIIGLQSSYGFLKSDSHHSENINGYLTYSQIPGFNGSITLSGTYLSSSFMNGKIAGASISHDLMKGKLHIDLGYNFVDYRLPESLQNLIQNIGRINISWQLSTTMSLSLYNEATFEKQNRSDQLYLQIRKRF